MVHRPRRAAPTRSRRPGARPADPSATTPCWSSGSSSTPRHIEIQVLADTHGNVIHLGERECSLQRRHQKIIEEAPSPLLDDGAARARWVPRRSRRPARWATPARARSSSSSTPTGRRRLTFFFMEMNTRLQVEHPVTEMVTGARPRRAAAAGRRRRAAAVGRRTSASTGHAVEARVYAEDPASGFLPTGGTVLALHEPAGPGCGSTRVWRRGSSSAPTTTRCWPRSSPTARDRARRLRRLDARAGATPCCSASTPTSASCGPCSPTTTSAPARLDTGLVEPPRHRVDHVGAARRRAGRRRGPTRCSRSSPPGRWSTRGTCPAAGASASPPGPRWRMQVSGRRAGRGAGARPRRGGRVRRRGRPLRRSAGPPP